MYNELSLEVRISAHVLRFTFIQFMSTSTAHPLPSFSTFGELLHYLRRRARLTQRELSIAVGYSESMISRLEHNERPPDVATLLAIFVPALHVAGEPEVVSRHWRKRRAAKYQPKASRLKFQW